ncbi:MAG TPA: thioredoxin [Gemmataceae bacterium]|jgi:putative thioredoxin|nr:thioredoxin [Gemmataceae bacterium]
MAANQWVIDVSEETFERDVLERSKTVPVVVDFWAEWCGPCKQLGPVLEKAAADRKGGFVLAKVNIDEAQQLAGYFRIESIPAVLAFKNGEAVNGFVGLLPPDDIKQFLDGLTGPTADDPMVVAAGLESSDPKKAEQTYRDMIAKDEKNDPARLGLARVLVATDRDEEALTTLSTIPDAGEFGAEAVKLRRTVEMRKNAATAGNEAELRKRIAASPDNAQLRLELGNVLATHGQYQDALEVLLQAADLDRELGRGPVRELMVKVFEIIGVRSEMADKYRDQLRAMLY